MDISDVLSLVAIIVNGLAIVVGAILLFLEIRMNKKFSNKQKMLNNVYDLVYLNFPKAVSEIINIEPLNRTHIKKVKTMLCTEIKPQFSFLVFRNKKKYDEIKALLNEIENALGNMLNKNIEPIEKRNNLSRCMSKFYQVLDDYFEFIK